MKTFYSTKQHLHTFSQAAGKGLIIRARLSIKKFSRPQSLAREWLRLELLNKIKFPKNCKNVPAIKFE